jgi:uncharacterized protein (TIGR03437 family)
MPLTIGTNPTGQPFSIQVVPDSQFVSVAPASGTTPQVVQVTATAAGLISGQQASRIVRLSSGSLTPLDVVVTINASGTASQLSSNLALVTFSYTAGGTVPGNQSITILGPSGQQIQYLVQAMSSGWLTAEPGVGNTTTNNVITVGLNAQAVQQLQPGTYEGTVRVAPTGAGVTTPLDVPVRLTVIGQPTLSVSPSSLQFAWQIGTAAPTPIPLTVSAQNTTTPIIFQSTVENQSTACGNWLPFALSGATSQTAPVMINTQGITTGQTCRANIHFDAVGVPRVTVPVTLVASTTPLLTLSAGAAEFNMQVSGTLPAAQALRVGATSGSLNFSATSDAPWLSVTPATGTTGNDISVSLTAAAQQLAPGRHTANVSLQSTTAGAPSTLTLPVVLNIGNNPTLITDQSKLRFVLQVGAGTVPDQVLIVSSTGTPITFTAAASTQTGGAWLTVIPENTQLVTPAPVSVRVTGSAPGTWNGTITLTPSTAGASPVSVPVELVIATTPLLRVSPGEISRTFAPGAAGETVNLNVTSTGDQLDYAFTVQLNNGFGWLTTGPTQGRTPNVIAVGLNPAGQPAGTYTGTLTISPPAVPGQPAPQPYQTIPIRMTVTAGTIQLSSTSLTFEQAAGAPAPDAQTVNITTPGGGALNFFVTTDPSAPWLRTDPTSGNTPGTLRVMVNAATSLAPGTYNGVLTVQAPGASNSPQLIRVRLDVSQPRTITVARTSISVNAIAGSSTPVTETVRVEGSGTGMTYTAVAEAQSGGNWLSVTPASGNLPQNLTISVNAANLNPGTYNGTVRITSGGAANSPQAINVTVTVGAPPITPGQILNAASGLPGPVAPGEILSIFGTNLGPATGVATQFTNNRADTALGQVRVLFDGIAAPLLFVRQDQINVVAPWEIAGRLSTNIVVEYQGRVSTGIPVSVAQAAPGIFTVPAGGRGQAAALNQDNSFNGDTPARPGSVLQVYLTGGGVSTPAVANGIVETQGRRTSAPVVATLGGRPVGVDYAGSAPGLISGAFQVNVRLTDTLDDSQVGNAVPLVISVAGVPSQQVTVRVAR